MGVATAICHVGVEEKPRPPRGDGGGQVEAKVAQLVVKRKTGQLSYSLI